MYTEPELLNERLERLAMVLDKIMPNCALLVRDALELLKEQEEQKRKWLQNIADNQIANAPKDSPMSLDEMLESEYKSGICEGLQIAFEILTEGR